MDGGRSSVYLPLPRYWVSSTAVKEFFTGRWDRKWVIGWRQQGHGEPSRPGNGGTGLRRNAVARLEAASGLCGGGLRPRNSRSQLHATSD